MPTATMHIAEVGGYVDRARCFRVDPPFEGAAYVTVWTQPAYGHQLAEISVVPATESGAAVGRTLMRRPGSYVIHAPCTTDEEFAGYCWLALLMLGQPGYDLVGE